jgi:hypothetical protein
MWSDRRVALEDGFLVLSLTNNEKAGTGERRRSYRSQLGGEKAGSQSEYFEEGLVIPMVTWSGGFYGMSAAAAFRDLGVMLSDFLTPLEPFVTFSIPAP